MILIEVKHEIINFLEAGVTLTVKREDLIHPFVSGNKYRKLKYNLLQAEQEHQKTVLTFGGAFSNHIAATAAAGYNYGFKTIGIIRGDELASKVEENPTLSFARKQGMELQFVSREEYRKKTEESFLDKLRAQYGDFYLLPEGGTNALAVKGCEEILTAKDADFDYICCAVGTGGTIAGIINSVKPHQKVFGFPALKGDFLQEEICKFAKNEQWELISDYHFGGYGKVTQELIVFINEIYQKYGIPLDPIYTGKLFFGVMDLIHKGFFPKGSEIMVIHTGGLQGIQGINKKLEQKHLPIINVNV